MFNFAIKMGKKSQTLKGKMMLAKDRKSVGISKPTI